MHTVNLQFAILHLDYDTRTVLSDSGCLKV